jgi:hypothetical protein
VKWQFFTDKLAEERLSDQQISGLAVHVKTNKNSGG